MQYMIIVLSIKIFFMRPEKSTKVHLRIVYISKFFKDRKYATGPPGVSENFVGIPNVLELATTLTEL